MYYTYANCSNLTGSPVCGNNVTNMYATYTNCSNLTGSPACSKNVTVMSFAYNNCRNLTGSPVCGPNVTNMSSTYKNCRKITGTPVCGNNVTMINYAYENCISLIGSPVCGANVTSMINTYYNCYNLKGNAYFYSDKIANMKSCFTNRYTNSVLKIYVNNGTTSLNTMLRNNASSMVGKSITWTNSGSYYYNTQYNIYIYPVENVVNARIANGD